MLYWCSLFLPAKCHVPLFLLPFSLAVVFVPFYSGELGTFLLGPVHLWPFCSEWSQIWFYRFFWPSDVLSHFLRRQEVGLLQISMKAESNSTLFGFRKSSVMERILRDQDFNYRLSNRNKTEYLFYLNFCDLCILLWPSGHLKRIIISGSAVIGMWRASNQIKVIS